MNENYEVKGHVFRIEQRQPCISGLEHLPDRKNFDVELCRSGKVTRLTNYTGGQVVRGSERFVYDGSGRLIHSLAFDNQGAETSNTEYEYGAKGISTDWTTRDNSGKIVGRGAEEYAGGLLVSHTTFRAGGLMSVKRTFEYAGGKLRKSFSSYHGPGGEIAEQWISAYDSLERLVETFGLKPDGKPLGDGRYTYEYNDAGWRTRVLSFNDTVNETVPNCVTQFAYACDEHGNWIERREASRFRSDSRWRQRVTTRKLTYYTSC
jgi:hypothetical protein